MFCDGCGTVVQPGQAFCSKCGKQIVGPIAFMQPRPGRVQEHIRFVGLLWLAISAFNTIGGIALYIVANTILVHRYTPGQEGGPPAFLTPPSVLNIGAHSAPFDDLSGRVGQRTSTEEKPAILSIEVPEARLHFTGLAGSQNGSPAFEQLGQVFGVDRSLPPLAIGFVNAKAGVFAPALIEEVNAPVRERSPYQSEKRIDDLVELVLHTGPF